tara:strand:+ start:8228 stop:8716 length:489 start_codon:yes stop_codon:yes gene_type:complete
LTNSFQTKIFNFFQKNNITDFVGVPDSTLKEFISLGLKNKKIIVTTREEEAIGIATGICLSGSNSLVFMQNAGFANSLSTITSLVKLYKIPIIFLIGWRGYLKDDAPEHIMIGKVQPELIKTIKLPSKILSEDNWEQNCIWALKKIKNDSPCALIVKREFHD